MSFEKNIDLNLYWIAKREAIRCDLIKSQVLYLGDKLNTSEHVFDKWITSISCITGVKFNLSSAYSNI